MDCPVCMERYDLGRRRPKSLPCGHTLCLRCLLQPQLGNRCPQDRQVFTGAAAQLSDNIALISLILLIPWCRDCEGDFTNDCASAGHRACSQQQRRAERVEPQLQQLQEGSAAGDRVFEVLESAAAAWRACLAPLEAALQGLRAAVRSGADIEAAVEAAALQARRVPALQQAARIADARGHCSLRLEADDGGVWEARLPLGATDDTVEPLLRHLLLQAHADGRLREPSQVEQPPAAPQPKAPTWPIWRLTLDLNGQSRNEVRCRDLDDVVEKARRAQPHGIRNLSCSTERPPGFVSRLLEAASPSLRELHMSYPSEEHMRLVGGMACLRALHLGCSYSKVEATTLPASLQELRGLECREPATLLAVNSLPNLRSLEIKYRGEPVELPSNGRRRGDGLQRLVVNMERSNEGTLLSLVRAHASSLEELQLYWDGRSGNKQEYSFVNLTDGLRLCGLERLRRLVLLRVRHDRDFCLRQRRELRQALEPAIGRRTEAVMCDRCNPEPYVYFSD